MSMSTTIDPNEGSSTKPLLRAHQFGGVNYKYMECLKNHAAGIGGNATDGCREFMAGGEPGSLEALKCCACNCHRNFHRKIIIHDQVQVQVQEIVASSSSSGRRRKRFRSKFSDRES